MWVKTFKHVQNFASIEMSLDTRSTRRFKFSLKIKHKANTRTLNCAVWPERTRDLPSQATKQNE